MASFGGHLLNERHYRERWNDYIAIHPTPPPTPDSPKLHLANDRELHKCGYVNVYESFVVNPSWLLPYVRYTSLDYLQFTEESFDLVARKHGVSPLAYVKERRLIEDRDRCCLSDTKTEGPKARGEPSQDHLKERLEPTKPLAVEDTAPLESQHSAEPVKQCTITES